jgi:hypothetical protein
MKVLVIATSGEQAESVAHAIRRIRERLGPIISVSVKYL